MNPNGYAFLHVSAVAAARGILEINALCYRGAKKQRTTLSILSARKVLVLEVGEIGRMLQVQYTMCDEAPLV